MGLFLPQIRIQRPPVGRAELLLSHPLNRGICFASVADSAQAFDLISRNAAPLRSADSYVPSPMGPSWKFTANSTNSGHDFGVFNPITTSDGAGGGDFAIGAYANPTAAAGIATLIDQRKGAASNEQIGLFANSTKALSASSGIMAGVTASTAGVTQGCQSVAGMVDGLPHVWEFRRLGTAHSIWRDGLNVTNTSDVSANVVWSVNQSFEIGAAAALTSATFGANCNIVFCWALNRAPDDGQMLLSGQNPWQRFKSIQPRLYFAGASVTDSAVGTSAGASTATGVGASSAASVGTSAGTSTAAGVGASSAATVGTAAGTSTAAGVGDFDVSGSTVGTSDGTSTAVGVGGVVVIGAPTEFLLPNAATLDANGLRKHYRFDVVETNGVLIRAANGNTIVIGPLETAADGAVQSTTPGTTLHLGARANGTQWVALSEVPSGGWAAV